jgi:hypothetical protein
MQIEPKQCAQWLEKANEIREDSYRNDAGERYDTERATVDHEWNRLGRWRYRKGWQECCIEAGMPEVWAALLAPYASSGYGDLWDWCADQTKGD